MSTFYFSSFKLLLVTTIGFFILLDGNIAYASSENFQCEQIISTQVCTEKKFLKNNSNLSKRLKVAIRSDLRKIHQLRIDPVAKKKLESVHITIDQSDGSFAWYHIGEGWLKENGQDIFKADSVNIASPYGYMGYRKYGQPWILTHELAHGYYFQHLTSDEKKLVEDAFKRVVKSKKYLYVERDNYSWKVSGTAYALENSTEYFSEMTETYFGRNDYYPYTRKDLKEFDVESYALMQTIWGGRTE